MTNITRLDGRGVVAVSGPDRVAFLNGLVSNDVARVAAGQAVWAAMLTAQGRYVVDFFILHDEDALLLDAPAASVTELARRLSRYRLRAAVAVEEAPQYAVYAAWDGLPPAVPVTAPDPRLREAGFRMLSTEIVEQTASQAAYDAHRLDLGLPDGPPDLEPEKTLLLEAGFDELNGVDWKKGCYMGQELTARTKYRGLVKKRLVPVVLEGAAAVGTPVLADGNEVGTIRSSVGPLALAMLRVDALEKPLIAGVLVGAAEIAALVCGAGVKKFVLAAMLLLAGCGAPLAPAGFAGSGAPFDPVGFFTGHVTSWGVEENRDGRPTGLVTTDCVGTVTGPHSIRMVQTLHVGGGVQTRTWQLTQSADGTYTATANDMAGQAIGLVGGRAMHWRWTLETSPGNSLKNVTMDQWFYRMDDGAVVVRTVVSKLGVRLIEVSEQFVKVG